MKQYLFAAEADQIQRFVFRSAKLREVRGASRMLDEFCKNVPSILAGNLSLTDQDWKIVSNAGGAFRIVFNNQENALCFGRRLAEMYRQVADASMSIAELIEFKEGGFVIAQNLANAALRQAKRMGRATQSTSHLPHIALCASCGIELATTFEQRHSDERANYLCDTCREKASIGPCSSTKRQ